MQSISMLLGILLLGQVGSSADSRYPEKQYTETELRPAVQQPSQSIPVTQDRYSPPSSNTTQGNPNSAETTSAALPSTKPVTLLHNLIVVPEQRQLSGVPVSLVDAIRGASSRTEQTVRIEAYWELSAAVTDYYLALRESTELNTLRQSVAQPGIVWDNARRDLDSRVELAKLSALTAQYRLAGMLGQPLATESLPLPSDLPHCGAYETRFEEIFSDGTPAPPAAQRLDKLLTLDYQNLQNQSDGVIAAWKDLQSVSERRLPQSDGAELLQSHELMALRRREFVRAVRNYNQQIARYTELVTPDTVATERLVAMLIHVEKLDRPLEGTSEIQQTSAEAPIDNPRVEQKSIQTFTGGNHSPPSQPPANDSNVERSILIQPRSGGPTIRR